MNNFSKMTYTTMEERFDKGVSNLLDNTSERDRDIYFAFKDFITTEIETARIETLRGVIASIRSAKVHPPRHADEEPFYEIKTKWLEELKGEILAALQAPDLSDKE